MNTRTSNSQMNGRSWSASSRRVISTGMLALALAGALTLNVFAPARVARAAQIAPSGATNAALMRPASAIPSGGASGASYLARKSHIAPSQSSGADCLSVVGTGSRAWRALAANYQLCPL